MSVKRIVCFSICLATNYLLLHAESKKTLEAIYLTQPLKVDGYLNEAAYLNAKPARDFVQIQPYNGRPSYQPTEVSVFYDENALYLGAMLYDSCPDSIFNYLTERDRTSKSDYFGVYIDPYNQGQIAYGFFITPAGVQIDIKATKSSDDNEDAGWDAVLETKTRVADNGWVVEMRIPYSALRFSKKSSTNWGLNFIRNIRRYNSNNSWNLIDRKVSGFIHQSGELTGLKNIKPPVRLSVNPYLSGYYEPGNKSKSAFVYKGGVDVKYGVNDAFTLDMMLIPDFGQVQSDDQQLNLSPYELYYDEKRQFFTEGTELFNRADIFYSRRIGAAPKFSADNSLLKNETVASTPLETKIVNATKFSGRTNKGWGLGILNAMTLPSYAEIENTETGYERKQLVQPFTNYNVLVVDKTLNNNSYVSVINTNLSMYDHSFYANVTATEFSLRNKSATYALKGNAAISSRYNNENETGLKAKIGIEKVKGKLFWGLYEHFYDDKYNPNDMGYLQHNNRVTTEAWMYYQIIEPFAVFKEANGLFWWNYNRMYNPNTFFDHEMGYDLTARLRNNYDITTNFFFRTNQYDYYEPRVAGRYFYDPALFYFKFKIESDLRKPLTVGASYKYTYQPVFSHYCNDYLLTLDWKIGQHLNLSYDVNYTDSRKDRGYVAIGNGNDSIVFAQRNVYSLSNIFQIGYVLNNKSNISLRARHYWSGVENNRYFVLNQDGHLSDYKKYTGSADLNYNALTMDVIYSWIFAPGSEISIGLKTLAYTYTSTPDFSYWNNLKNSWLSKDNIVSLKVLYYIDYNKLFKKQK
jgi:hypothetical protein